MRSSSSSCAAGAIAEERARRAETANEALRDEVWRLKEAARRRDRAEAASEAKSRFLADDEPRNPHAAARHSRHGRSAARRGARAGTRELCRGDPRLRRGARRTRSTRSSISRRSRPDGSNLIEEPFDPRRWSRSIVELLAPLAQSKGLEIAASIAADVPALVLGDSLRLRQALTNLAGNAVKFTRAGGVGVDVCASSKTGVSPSTYRTPAPACRATGGRKSSKISSRATARTPSFRGRRARPRHLQAAVELMGGELALADNPGGGSIFSFAIALAEALPATGQARRRARRPQRAARADRRRFAVRGAGARWLRCSNEAGAEIARAEGLEAGLAALRRRRAPDLVIVDCALGVGSDQPARRSRARRRRAEKPRAVLAVRAARLRAERAQRLRRLAGQAGARPLAVRAARRRICASEPAVADAAEAAPDRAALRARCWPRTTTSTQSSPRRRCDGSDSRWCRARDGAGSGRARGRVHARRKRRPSISS